MPELPENNLSIDQVLSAFADGELDAAQRLEALDYLATHPESMQWIRDQQRLSLSARRLLNSPEAKASTHLREQISRLNKPSAKPLAPARTDPQIAFGKWWMGLAACLLVAFGIGVERFVFPSVSSVAPFGQTPSSQPPVIAASIVAHASRVHADCSRLAEGLHAAGYPKSQGELAANVERDLHSDQPYPNLTPIGFRYVGAGPCGDPLPDTIHLLYRTMAPGFPKAISLFVQPYHDQFALELGKIYDVAGPASPFPVLSWRTEHVVYFLIADTDQPEQKALSLIRGDITDPAAATTEPTSNR